MLNVLTELLVSKYRYLPIQYQRFFFSIGCCIADPFYTKYRFLFLRYILSEKFSLIDTNTFLLPLLTIRKTQQR